MGRPSVQNQRKAEILDAFLTCVAAYGVEGATLERLASASGLKRPLIRHHLGNRDDMVRALAHEVTEKQIDLCNNLRDALDGHPGLRNFVDALFSDDAANDPRMNTAYQALVTSVERYPDLRDPLLNVMQAFYGLAVDVTKAAHPDAATRDCEIVAHGIVDLYLMSDSLAPLRPPAHWSTASYRAAVRLAESLDR